jgi:CRP-like cAMP-binding protein
MIQLDLEEYLKHIACFLYILYRCVLGPGEFFGEEAFLMEDGRTFILKVFNIFSIKWAKLKCSVICRS